MEIKIGTHSLGQHHPPFIIAELSGNHQHSLEKVYELIQSAKKCGVQAIKLQTYTPDTITLPSKRKEFLIEEEKSLWHGRYLYDIYEEAHLPWDWHAPIFAFCKQQNILCFSSPFDETAVDFLEDLETPCYKIASPEIVDHPLIKRVAMTGKPLFLSTGAATLLEIVEAVEVAKEAGCEKLILLKCTAAYPAAPQDMHLKTITHLKSTFGTLVGLSDHSLGIGVAIAAVALGACVIEKHFTLLRAEGGVDSAFSAEPSEMAQLVTETKAAWQALGSTHYNSLEAEKVTRSHRPSLYFVEDLPTQTVITAQHMRTVRPSNGLPPKHFLRLIGLKLQKPAIKGTPVSWDHFVCE